MEKTHISGIYLSSHCYWMDDGGDGRKALLQAADPEVQGKCPRQFDSVGCGYYVQKYIHEIVHNSSTSITNLFNTKNAYRQEEIDEIRTE
ncbi:uncharacterized protein E5676_scaffold629G001930 [Cucumis melo var. makuwa]|uniref:Uncharacterized protein n=1 Tax=Cucumis melo var. makuwa TaxID=1194695 RepID=A0A5D3DXF6_CUCMM|nr:uncharacterized protein E5676_scaffold629G001930 [Cucumis melo var. makuwa]